MAEKACPQCKMLVKGKECPVCKRSDLVKEWKGMIIIIDPARSEIAKKLGITVKGRYALKVRR